MPLTQADAEHAPTIIATLVSIIGILVAIIGFAVKYIVGSFNGRIKSMVINMDEQDKRVDKLEHSLTVLQTEHKMRHYADPSPD